MPLRRTTLAYAPLVSLTASTVLATTAPRAMANPVPATAATAEPGAIAAARAPAAVAASAAPTVIAASAARAPAASAATVIAATHPSATAAPAVGPTSTAPPPPAEPSFRAAAEVNVLWPAIGISELKILLPASRGSRRGEVVLGAYLDYAQVVRSGRAFIIAALPGYRQFLGAGFHVELCVNLGVRHEANHPGDGATLNDLYVRAWPALGYQHELSPRFYVNARARAGVLVYRQTHQDEEKQLALAGDLNVGVRF